MPTLHQKVTGTPINLVSALSLIDSATYEVYLDEPIIASSIVRLSEQTAQPDTDTSQNSRPIFARKEIFITPKGTPIWAWSPYENELSIVISDVA